MLLISTILLTAFLHVGAIFEKAPTIIVDLPISLCHYLTFCFTQFDTLFIDI